MREKSNRCEEQLSTFLLFLLAASAGGRPVFRQQADETAAMGRGQNPSYFTNGVSPCVFPAAPAKPAIAFFLRED